MSFLPKQTAFIIGNEACERFSFYGMKGLLTLYATGHLLLSEETAISLTHFFTALVYLTPLAGAWLADRVLGKYHTILYVSLLYCLGHGILATSDLFPLVESKRMVMYIGLAVIGLGAGGIKPCVSTFMGDQIQNKSPKIMTRAYSAFYWSINLGSFFAFIIIPAVSERYGYGWAFGIPGIFMGLATFILWLGRKRYVMIPPQKVEKKTGFWSILFHMLFKGGSASAALKFGEDRVRETKRVLNILSIFIFVVPFWALFDQTSSSWQLQGDQMIPLQTPFTLDGQPFVIGARQIQSANPAFIMVLVPLISIFVYPYIGRFARPLFRMGAGLFLAAASFAVVAWLQHRLDNGESLSIAWQVLPYLVLTVGEILLSTTGLEFAYTQAPANFKSLITSCWNVTIFLGNLIVPCITWVLYNLNCKAVSPQGFLVYSAMTAGVAIFFAMAAKRYAKQPA